MVIYSYLEPHTLSSLPSNNDFSMAVVAIFNSSVSSIRYFFRLFFFSFYFPVHSFLCIHSIRCLCFFCLLFFLTLLIILLMYIYIYRLRQASKLHSHCQKLFTHAFLRKNWMLRIDRNWQKIAKTDIFYQFFRNIWQIASNHTKSK